MSYENTNTPVMTSLTCMQYIAGMYQIGEITKEKRNRLTNLCLSCQNKKDFSPLFGEMTEIYEQTNSGIAKCIIDCLFVGRRNTNG